VYAIVDFEPFSSVPVAGEAKTMGAVKNDSPVQTPFFKRAPA
jgi:hypothetical protein